MGITEKVHKYLNEMTEMRRDLHRHPELGMREVYTCNLIRRELMRYGVEIEERGMLSGVSAIIRGAKPGKTVALRGDIDALPIQEETGLPFASETPGYSHACGHDIHATTMLFCARILAEYRHQLAGNVRILFQPAEELASGASMMIAHGVMENPKPDVIIGVHCGPDVPAGKIGLIKGPANAAFDKINITVKGVGGHGAHRYRAVDPIMIGAFLITQMNTIVTCEIPALHPTVLNFGTFHSGTAPNVVPPEAVITGTLRSYDQSWRDKAKQAIRRMAEHTCKSMKAEAIVEIEDGLPPLIHDPDTVDKVAEAVKRTLGEDKIYQLPMPSPGSDDFSAFLDYCPGVRFRLGTGSQEKPETLYGTHHPKNVFDECAILTGTAVCCQFVLDYLK